MTQFTYYTVIIGKRSSLVKYAQAPAYEVKLFPRSFVDPGEASQQFKSTVQGKFEYLTPGVFDRKIDSLSSRYQQDMAKLQDWNQGKPALHQAERTEPMALTNEQFFGALPPNGLELAEEYLMQDLGTLQENRLPVSDTVAGLLMVHDLQEEQEEEEPDDL